MSSRLFIAKFATLLLMLLGGVGLAMADTGVGSPKKGSTITTIIPDISDLTISSGGNVINSQVICANRTITITPTIAGGASIVSYTITPSFGFSSTQSSANSANGFAIDYVVAPAPGGGSLTVVATVLNNDGVDTYSEVFTVLNPSAGSAVAVPPSICLGSPVAISLTSPGNLTVTGGSPFTGGPSGVNFVNITPSTAGANTFTVNGSDVPGCSFQTSVAVNVNAPPTATVVAYPNPVCAGSPVSFSLNQSGVTSATVSGATLGANASPFISTTTTSAASAGGTFAVSYTVTNSSGCTAVVTGSYVVSALPANGPAVSLVAGTTLLGSADATASSQVLSNGGSFSVCQNSSLVLSLSACPTSSLTSGGGSGGASSVVTVGPGYVIITSASGTQSTIANGITSYNLSTSATGTGGYQIACINDLGCSSTAVASFTLTVLPTPNSATIVGSTLPGSGAGATFAGQNIQLCQGQSLTATVNCPTGSAISALPISSSLYATPTLSPTSNASAISFTLTASATASGSQAFTVACNSTSGSPVCPSLPVNYTLTVNPRPANGPTVAVAYSTSALNSLTITSAAASSGSAISVCQNTPLSLSVLGCVTSSTNTGATNPITQVSGPGGSVGVGASVTLAGGAVQDVYTISTANLSTTATGPYVYTIACVNTSGCSSTAIASLSVTVNPTTDLASITAVNGTPANLAIAGGGTGSVQICQSSSPLIVNSNCLVTPGGSATAGGTVVASNTAGVGIGASTTATSSTFVSFSVSAATVGTFSYSFACQNSSGCISPQFTVLTVTVSASAAAPTAATAVIACENSGNVVFATGCGTNSATIVSRPTPDASSATITGNSLVLGTVNSGTYVYGIQCQTTAGCSSSTTSYTLIVNPRPDNANLTVVNGTIADRNVAGGTLGSVSICQGASLTVNTNCLIATGSTSTSAGNTIGGSTSGTSGTAVGGGVVSTGTSTTNASFLISTTATGVSTFTFVCVNALGCPSQLTTTLVVTVNETPTGPTITNASSVTGCETPGGLLAVTASCATASSSLVVTGASGITTLAALRSSATAGVFSYTLQCVTPTCVSSTSVVSTTIVARPNLASLTAVNGNPANLAVAGGSTGAVQICQGASLTVNTNCLIAAGSTNSVGGNTIGGINTGGTSGTTGTDGTTAAVGGGTSTSTSSSTFASFTISTASTGTFNYTFVCQNSAGCVSPEVTTLAVTVSSSVATPTFTGTQTACLNSNALTVSGACSTASSTLVITSGGTPVSIADVNSTSAVGSRAYTLQCVTPTCVSSTTSLTVTVRDLPANAGLTVNSGSQTLTTVVAGGSGSVPVCQGQSLTVVTSCVINTTTASGSANVATGVTSGSVNQDGSIVAIASGVTDGTSSTTYAAFVISTTAVNTTTFTFRCQNEFGCTSPIATTLALTVSNSVAGPTITDATAVTACENSGLLAVSASCSTPSNVSLVVTGASGITTLADLRSTAKAAGVYSYTLQCVTPSCVSSTSVVSTTIAARPNLASLTATNGTMAMVAGGMAGSVSICQGVGPLNVITNCLLSSTTTTGTSNTASGVNNGGIAGVDGTTAATGGAINTDLTSQTFAAFNITTTLTGTTTFTFNCVNASGCASPQATTLTVTVSQSASAPTLSLASSVSVCQNAALSNVATCAVGSAVFTTGGVSTTTGSFSINTGTPGTQTFSVVCRTAAGCVSSPVAFTVLVNGTPNNAIVDVTTSAGATLNVPGGTSGAITICEGTSLTGIVTACPTTSGTVGGGAAPIAGSGQISVGGSTPVSTTSSQNAFTIPSSLTAGTYFYTVVCQSVAGSATCVSPMTTTLVVTVNGAPVSPTGTYALGGFAGSGAQPSAPLTTTTNITVCQNNPISLTIVGCNPDTPGSNNSVPGQTSGSAVLGGSQIIDASTNNSFFTIPNTTAGVFQYTVVCTNPVTGCRSLTPITINVTVNATPSSPLLTGNIGSGQSLTLCQGKSAIGTITCPVGSFPSSNANSLISPAVSAISANVLNFTATASTSQTGVASFSVVCISTQGCPSLPTTYTLTVNPIPANAGLTVSPASTPNPIVGGMGGSLTVCQNTPISVTVTGCPTIDTAGSTSQVASGGNTGFNFGGTQITPGQTGINTFTIPTTTTGTFVYTANCTNSFGCSSSAVTSLTVTVNSLPVNPVASNTVVACETTSGILTIPTGCGTSPSTVTAVVTGSTALTSNGGLTSTNTYTISTAGLGGAVRSGTLTIFCRNVATGCVSTSTSTVNVTINPAPNNASLTAVGTSVVLGTTVIPASGPGAITVCQGSSLTVNTNCLIGTNPTTNPGNSLTGVNGGSIVGSAGSNTLVGVGNVVTSAGSTSVYASYLVGTSITGVSTFTFNCVSTAGCSSLQSTTLAVTVQEQPSNPAPTASQGVLPNLVVCEGGSGSALTITSGCTPSSSVTAVFTIPSTLTSRATVTGNSLVISTSGLNGTAVTGSISVICRNVSTSCVSANSSTISLTINPAPNGPTAATIGAGTFASTSSLTICQGQPVSLTVDGCLTPTGSGGATSIGGNGTGFVFTGTGFTFTPTGPTTSTALVTDGNLQQGIYTFDVKCKSASTMCESLTGNRSFTLVVTGQPSTPIASGFAPTCVGGGPVTGLINCPTGTLSSTIVNSAGVVVNTYSGPSTTYNFGILPAPIAGSYTLTATCSTGGACVSMPLTLTVNNQVNTPAPTTVRTVQNAICLGLSTTLVAGCPTVGSTAIWYITGTNTVVSGTALGATSLIVAPLQQGQYSYQAVCTDPAFGCASAPSTAILLDVLPGVNSLPTISAQPNPSVAGQAVTLTGAGCAGTTIFYIQGTNTEVGRGMGGLVSVTVSPQVSTTYDAVCTNGQCTSNRTTGLVVFVVPCTFTANVTPSSAVLCPGAGSVTLTASGGASYLWNNGLNTQSIVVSVPGVYNVVVTSAQGCTFATSATVTAGSVPAPSISGNTAIFAGQSTTLTAAGGGLYAWTGPGLVNAQGATQVVSTSGLYTVTVTSPTGCTASASVTVTVNPLPAAPTVSSTSVQACVGQSVVLTANCAVGTPRFKLGTVNNDSATQTVTSSTPGTITYQVVCVQNGVEGPATTASVTFNALPTINVFGALSICTNPTGGATSTTLTATGASSYTWSTGETTASIVVSSAGVVSVSGTSAAGCVASATRTVSSSFCGQPAAPTIVQGTNVQACVGQQVNLQANCAVGTPRFKLGTVVNDSPFQLVSSLNPTSIVYQVVCVASGVESPATSVQVVFSTAPTVGILVSGVLCNNQPSSVTLTATGASSYTWSNGVVGSSIVVNSVGMVSVNGSNAAGCIGTATQMVSATNCGAITALQVLTATIDCTNGNVTISATGGNGNQIQYSIGGVQYSAGSTVALDPAFLNNPANTFIQLFARQVNSTSTGFDVAGPFQFNFRAICPVTTTPPSPTTSVPPSSTCGSPANTIGQPLVVTGVTDINCLNGTFRVLTTGGDATPICYSLIIGLSNADEFNCVRRVDNGEQLAAINNPNSTIVPFGVRVRQSGGMSNTFSFDFKAACTNGATAPVATTPPASTTTAPPTNANTAGCGSPANTVGQPLTITNVDQVNCAAGTFRILTTGGNGNTINYANIVGLSNTDPYNCTRTLDNPDLTAQVNNPSSTIAPFQLRVMNVGGSVSNTFSFNMKQVCTGTPRVARTEGTGSLDVTVLGNPTLGESVEVEVRGAEGQALQLRLVDAMGAAISEKSVEKAGTVERQTIGLGRSAGMYFLQVTTPTKTKTVKVVRQ